jgi:hypothetical protein
MAEKPAESADTLCCLYFNTCGFERFASIQELQSHLRDAHRWNSAMFPSLWPTDSNLDCWKLEKFRQLGNVRPDSDQFVFWTAEWLKADFKSWNGLLREDYVIRESQVQALVKQSHGEPWLPQLVEHLSGLTIEPLSGPVPGAFHGADLGAIPKAFPGAVPGKTRKPRAKRLGAGAGAVPGADPKASPGTVPGKTRKPRAKKLGAGAGTVPGADLGANPKASPGTVPGKVIKPKSKRKPKDLAKIPGVSLSSGKLEYVGGTIFPPRSLTSDQKRMVQQGFQHVLPDEHNFKVLEYLVFPENPELEQMFTDLVALKKVDSFL